MQGRSIFIQLLRCQLHMVSWQPDDCGRLLSVIPIISWIHHQAEACAMKEDFIAYVDWWTAVAKQLKDKDYRLSFKRVSL